MREQFDAQFWAEHHASFADAIDRLIGKAWIAFQRLNAIAFDAPWRSAPARCGQ